MSIPNYRMVKYRDELVALLARKPINHQEKILEHDNIKDAHAYCAVNQLSGQKSGPLIENFIRVNQGWVKNRASDHIGDCKDTNGVDQEIKISLGGSTFDKFNYVQLRPSHHADYLLTAFYLSPTNAASSAGELFIFKIPKASMLELIANYGQYAHGTRKKNGAITLKDLKNKSNPKEYALRPKYGSPLWKEMLKFKINEDAL